eukprot:238238-Chlamydomonas_euryale.AAC.4
MAVECWEQGQLQVWSVVHVGNLPGLRSARSKDGRRREVGERTGTLPGAVVCRKDGLAQAWGL